MQKGDRISGFVFIGLTAGHSAVWGCNCGFFYL